MPPALIAGAVGLAGSVGGALINKGTQKSATNAQVQSNAEAEAGLQRRFEQVQQLLAPYVQAGNTGLEGLLNLTGAQGAQAQQTAISGIEQSPMFQGLLQQGEQGILQNASATGGLRGGNVQGALAQFRPAMLNQQIQQQLAQFGGLASLGQNAAAGVGNAGLTTGQNIAGLTQDSGQARAFGALGKGQALAGGLSALTGFAGTALGGGFGGGMPNVNQIIAGANTSLGAGTPGMVRAF